jgi:hypothetical protein
MKKMIDENPDKYSEGNVVKNEPSEEEQLGFMDEEEIQPKQSAAMLEQHSEHILSSWKLVENIGLEKFGIVFFKNVIKFCPETLPLFSFKDAPNMYQSQLYKRYVLRVMEQFEKSTHQISNLDYLKEHMFKRIQGDNKEMGVTGNMIDKIQKAFIMTLEMGLKQKLTA